jgi:predicted dehydrogenase
MTENGRQLSCLVIGCGNIAGGFDAQRPDDLLPLTHAGAYAKHGGFNLVACVDPREESRIEFMRRWRVADGYQCIDGIREGLGSFDVISVCSPTGAHLDDVRAAISLKPRLIFCEKPLATSIGDAKQIVEACRKANIPLAVNYNRRWDRSVERLRQGLTDGSWGKIRSVQGIYTRGVMNNGSHMIDLLHLLFGNLRVMSVGLPVYDGFSEDPSIPAILLTGGGVPVTLSCGDARDYSVFELQIVTEKGLIAMEDGGLQWRFRRAIDSPFFRSFRSLDAGLERISGELPAAMLVAVTEIYEVLNGCSQLSSTGENALAAISICEDVRKMTSGIMAANAVENRKEFE